MDSIRERIFEAVKTVVQGVDGIGEVSRGKIDPLAINNYPAAFVLPGFDPVTDEVGTLVLRDLQVFLFLWIRTQLEIHKAVELFLPKVQAAMSADYTLGGLVTDISETAVSEPFPLNDEQSEAGVVLEFLCKYRTFRNDPYNH